MPVCPHMWPTPGGSTPTSKADVTAATIVIIEDNGKRGLRRILRAVIDAGAILVYVLSVESRPRRRSPTIGRASFPRSPA